MKIAKAVIASLLCVSLTGCMSVQLPGKEDESFNSEGGHFEKRGNEIIDHGMPQEEKDAKKKEIEELRNGAPGASKAPNKNSPLPGGETEEVTFEFESSEPTANITYTTENGAEAKENQKMPYKVNAKTFTAMGAASVSPAQTTKSNHRATYTCRVKKGNKVIADSVNSSIVASCIWTDSDFK